jgi:tetratricopeptide (TPR) repeat protein
MTPAVLGLAALLPASAQAPLAPDAAFFSQDPKSLMRLCADEAVLLSPKDTHLLAEYGDTMLALGDRKKAEEAFAKAVSKSPNDSQTHHLIGLAWLRKGFRQEALKAYEAMVSVDLSGRYERRKNIFTKAAVDLLSAGEVKVAADYMEQGFQLDKGDATNFLEFGRVALLTGNKDLASLYFARATKADPKDADVWLEITNAYAELLLRAAKRP